MDMTEGPAWVYVLKVLDVPGLYKVGYSLYPQERALGISSVLRRPLGVIFVARFVNRHEAYAIEQHTLHNLRLYRQQYRNEVFSEMVVASIATIHRAFIEAQREIYPRKRRVRGEFFTPVLKPEKRKSTCHKTKTKTAKTRQPASRSRTSLPRTKRAT